MSGGRTAKDPGDFVGHVLPGLAYVVFGTIWTYSILFRYHVARREAILKTGTVHRTNFRSSLFFTPYSGCWPGAPVQAFIVLLVPLAGIIGGIIMIYMDRNAPALVTADLHHMSVYTFFGLTCVAHILLHYKYPLPPNSDYVAFFVTTVVEALLFVGHIYGRAPMNQKMHLLMVYVIAATAACTAVEMANRTSVVAALGRSGCLTLTGLWLFPEAFVLYGPEFMPHWDQEDHSQIGRIEAMFALMIILLMLKICVINHLAYKQAKKLNLQTVCRILDLTYNEDASPTYDVEGHKHLMSDSDGE